jgi:MYXO-CTERM domain-containing protein
VVVDERGCGDRDALEESELPRSTPRIVDPADRQELQKECGCQSSGKSGEARGGAWGVLALSLLGVVLTRRRVRAGVLVSVALLGLGASACAELTGGAGDRPEGYRLVQGTFDLPDEEGFLGRQVTGVQVAALHIEGNSVVPYTSDVLDPASANLESAQFSVPVDGGDAFVLVLQIPSSSGQGPGELIARLSFPDGTGEGSLVPAGTTDLALGAVRGENGGGARGNRLVVADTANPLGQVDTDDDALSDLADSDDDDDGNPDASDEDRADDGILDVTQVLDAMTDDDDDGVPDALQ